MKTLPAVLLLLASAIHAEPLPRAQIDTMKAQCNGVMGRDVCRVMNEDEARSCKAGAAGRDCRLTAFRLRYPRGIALPAEKGPLARFTADEYFEFVDAGESMCDLIERSCGKDRDSRACLLARYLWRSR